MWVAKQENAKYTATIRRNGQFTGDSGDAIAAALFEHDWLTVRLALILRCNNQGAVALLDGEYGLARLWIGRAERLREIS